MLNYRSAYISKILVTSDLEVRYKPLGLFCNTPTHINLIPPCRSLFLGSMYCEHLLSIDYVSSLRAWHLIAHGDCTHNCGVMVLGRAPTPSRVLLCSTFLKDPEFNFIFTLFA